MPQETRAGLEAIRGLLNDCPHIDEVHVGVPERPGDVRVAASVSVLDSPESTRVTNTDRTDQNYLVIIEIAVEKGSAVDAEAAEFTLADIKDDIRGRFLSARNTAAHPLYPFSPRLVDELASRPDFIQRAGDEERQHPFVIALRQQRILPPNA